MTTEISLDAVCAIVRAAGIPCTVQQTGGGTATLYAGTPTPEVATWGGTIDAYPAVAGPGAFWAPGRPAYTEELSVGPDENAWPTKDYWQATETTTAADVAAEVIRRARANANDICTTCCKHRSGCDCEE
jgi:hypothetical protein